MPRSAFGSSVDPATLRELTQLARCRRTRCKTNLSVSFVDATVHITGSALREENWGSAVMSRSAVALLLVGVLVAAIGYVYVNIPEEVPVGIALRPDNEKLVSDGRTLYMLHCAECHGENLEGQPNWQRRDAEGYLPAPPHDETGHTWHHSDELLFRMTKHGIAALAGGGYKTNMPAYADVLSDEQIVAILSFIKSRWPENIRERHDRLNPNAAR